MIPKVCTIIEEQKWIGSIGTAWNDNETYLNSESLDMKKFKCHKKKKWRNLAEFHDY